MTQQRYNHAPKSAGDQRNRKSEGDMCTRFCCSDFYLFEDEQNFSYEDELDNKIHPFFSKARFRSFTMNEYADLKMTLRLASQYIQTDAFVEWVDTVVRGDLYVDVDPHAEPTARFKRPKAVELFTKWDPNTMNCEEDELPGHWKIFQDDYFQTRFFKTDIGAIYRGLRRTGETREHFFKRVALLQVPKRGQRNACPGMRNRVMEIMRHMQHLVQYNYEKLADNKFGYAIKVEGPLPFKLDKEFPWGIRCSVKLSVDRGCRMRDLIKACKDGGGSKVDLKRMELLIAGTIVHELAHCIMAAASGWPLSGKIHFRDNGIAEAGYDLMAHIHGGVVHLGAAYLPHFNNEDTHYPTEETNTEKQYLVMSEWPSGMRMITYKNKLGRRGELPKTDILTRVPKTYVMDLFTNKFWKDMKSSGSKSALRPKGPRWTEHFQTRRQRKAVFVDYLGKGLPLPEYEKLRQIVERQSSTRQGIAAIGGDDLFIMSTTEGLFVDPDEEPAVLTPAGSPGPPAVSEAAFQSSPTDQGPRPPFGMTDTTDTTPGIGSTSSSPPTGSESEIGTMSHRKKRKSSANTPQGWESETDLRSHNKRRSSARLRGEEASSPHCLE